MVGKRLLSFLNSVNFELKYPPSCRYIVQVVDRNGQRGSSEYKGTEIMKLLWINKLIYTHVADSFPMFAIYILQGACAYVHTVICYYAVFR